ncbi:transcriptional regulator [Sediminibacillus halophilus]|uniref:Phage transcriptional activator, RinA family n=1 Tax=Sediminibacillus halophilus TaxID=482461 RepID=A0A1G9QVP3_9BACI|nr:transcriptional regulator [Sediminibacillus halophilus]SDM15079.1 phage transcriptional activator, RinA family [Sediminibacillus halophilus]
MTTANKPKKITFKHAESEWYNYHQTLREIASLREEIMYPFDEDPKDKTIVKGANSVRHPGNPTERLATRLTTSRQLKYLEQVIRAIEEVYNALPSDYKELVKLRYWRKSHKLTWDGIAQELNVSRRQAIYWRDEIVQATVEVLGWR